MLDKIDRTDYEFTKETIIAILKEYNFMCRGCGRTKQELAEANEKPYFQIHHVLPIFIAVNYYPEISAEVIKSAANGEPLCESCHKNEHKQWKSKDYSAMARRLLPARQSA